MFKPSSATGKFATAFQLASVAVISLMMPMLAHAQPLVENRTVMELFTSQGCKPCLSADKNFNGFVDDPSVVALSFHVTYWDYRGWRDTLATKENTARQAAYRDALRAKMIYTPQLIINGQTELNGRESDAIAKAIDQTKTGPETGAKNARVSVSITPSDDERLVIDIGEGITSGAPIHVVLFYFKDAVVVPITQGENAGQSMTYRNTVHTIDTIGMWDGKPMRMEIPASELGKKSASGFAVLLQEVKQPDLPSTIYGAAIYKPDTKL